VRIVLDTDVMVAAVRSSRGASRRLLNAAVNCQFETLLSVPLMLEYEAVLKREAHLRAAQALPRDVKAILEALVEVATLVKLNFLWRPVMQDPNDEMVLDTAANGAADMIVTFNVRHFRNAATRFGIPILRPIEASQLLGV
jgi:putative PIN family toxin of toxin-antitoxin system